MGRCMGVCLIGGQIAQSKHLQLGTNDEESIGTKHGMQLMDDALFKLWMADRCTVEDVLARAQRPDDLAQRIVNAKRGMMEEEEEEEEGDKGAEDAA